MQSAPESALGGTSNHLLWYPHRAAQAATQKDTRSPGGSEEILDAYQARQEKKIPVAKSEPAASTQHISSTFWRSRCLQTGCREQKKLYHETRSNRWRSLSLLLLLSTSLQHSGEAAAFKPVSESQQCRMSNNMAKIAEARKTVEQLKLEVNIDRMKVSKAAADLLAYCETHAKEDPLMTPVPSAENPFREKRLFCIII
ncbi:hypothetical protein NDU88_004457 [Pleurodeles waltl]|uniref:Guanine nucleotide-binding protein subunit gamma n=2 Tax=Pleurodeles waltl TaxID=8319 RepID=A0AAV7N321_PLEWA|nr:hypothetical protein NDU88_004457 [Pleurodeles waltl]